MLRRTAAAAACRSRRLRHVKEAVIGLKSAGESFGRSREDFIDVHFFTLQIAEAALKLYEACKELNLRGKTYAVAASSGNRCNAGGAAVAGTGSSHSTAVCDRIDD